MKLIGLILCALAVAPAIAAGQGIAKPSFTRAQADILYVYGSPNKTYRCSIYIARFSGDGMDYYFAERCILAGTDSMDWPSEPFRQIRAWLFMANQVPPNPPSIGFDCSFVSNDRLTNGRTKTVVDCRPPTAEGPAAR